MKRTVPVALLLLAACNLGEITVAMPADIVVAEVVLRVGERQQTAYLHRTTSDYGNARVFDADIVVTDDATGRRLEYIAVSDTICLESVAEQLPSNRGTCYAATAPLDLVRGGSRYTLQISFPDGRRMAGSTVAPGEFEFRRPRIGGTGVPAVFHMLPQTTLEVEWTRSQGAWAYIGEANVSGLLTALQAGGVEVPQRERDVVRLLGVAVGSADTTMVFPGEFGLFDRFDEELHPVLVAVRSGLPPDVRTELAIAAADRNYVNWVRGGNFNPSGLVRLPSVTGDGTGVFGALVVRRVVLDSGAWERLQDSVRND